MITRSLTTWSLLLAGASLAACSGATQEAPRLPEQAATAPAASASCARSLASVADGRRTSKTRHLPDENSPCPDSRGLSSQPAAPPPN